MRQQSHPQHNPGSEAALPPIGHSINATARLIGVSRSKVNGLIRDGELRSVKIGRRRIVLDASIRALMRRAA